MSEVGSGPLKDGLHLPILHSAYPRQRKENKGNQSLSVHSVFCPEIKTKIRTKRLQISEEKGTSQTDKKTVKIDKHAKYMNRQKRQTDKQPK